MHEIKGQVGDGPVERYIHCIGIAWTPPSAVEADERTGRAFPRFLPSHSWGTYTMVSCSHGFGTIPHHRYTTLPHHTPSGDTPPDHANMVGKEELLVHCATYIRYEVGGNVQSTNRLTNLDLTKLSRDLRYKLLAR